MRDGWMVATPLSICSAVMGSILLIEKARGVV
jgi:hypothetical protein